MNTSRAHRFADPMKDHFSMAELPRVSPWSAQQIEAIGAEVFLNNADALGIDTHRPQKMSTWVTIISRARGPNWEEFDVA
jgi:hypothetical protein